MALKGNDAVYGSKNILSGYFNQIAPYARDRLLERIVYVGHPLSANAMGQLYQACDAYVSPYRAEGFNLPVLEAAACGLPVLCTEGGPTDEFVTPAFARKIRAERKSSPNGNWLEPYPDALVELMDNVIHDVPFQSSAMRTGPAHVAANYTWDHTAERILSL